MEKSEFYYDNLRRAVEHTIGRNMHTPKDFEYLSICIYDRTNDNISAMTLKRFWGYLGKKNIRKPRLDTLNILSKTLGYTDWSAYYSTCCACLDSQSDFLLNNYLESNSLDPGTELYVMWHPDRCIRLRYEGEEMYHVLESKNSKLSVGDQFRCPQIIENEALYLSNLIHEGGEPCHYVCGRIDGVKYFIINN